MKTVQRVRFSSDEVRSDEMKCAIRTLLSSTYSSKKLSNHAVPRSVRQPTSVLSVSDQRDFVVEVERLRQVLHQIWNESFKLFTISAAVGAPQKRIRLKVKTQTYIQSGPRSLLATK